MKEQDLNILMAVVTDPICNVYKIESAKDEEEIRRIVNIFNLNNSQQNKHRMFAIKNLATMRLVLSKN